MVDFISLIYDFIMSIISALDGLDTGFSNFLGKSVFLDSSLIGLNLTYNELLLFIGTLIVAVLFIVFIFKVFERILFIFKI